MSGYIALSWIDLAFAAIFLLLNAALSLALRLGLERQLLFNAVRMVVQLLMLGLVLKTVLLSVIVCHPLSIGRHFASMPQVRPKLWQRRFKPA